MGNLYTHIVRQPDKRLTILSQLKQEFRSSPRDWKRIKKLRKSLEKIESKPIKPKHPKRKVYKGMFG